MAEKIRIILSAMSERTLYFIWNAERNLKGALLGLYDIIKGIHSCSLCEIAYDCRKPKAKWDSYKAGLKSNHNITTIEYYKNQLPEEFETIIKNDFPSVVGRDSNQTLSILLGGKTITQCHGDINQFITLLDKAILNWINRS